MSASAVPRSFPWVASLLYVGVLCTWFYYSATGLCTKSVTAGRLIACVGLILSLLVLEQVAQRLFNALSPRYLAVTFLLARMVLFELVAAVDCSGFSRALYPIVPFAAYFSLGKRVSY